MTDKPTPTDAELKALWQIHAADIGGIFCYARAVLAKWGAPATGGEPAGTVGYTVHGTQYVNWRTKPPAHGTPLYTTSPQADSVQEDAARYRWPREGAGMYADDFAPQADSQPAVDALAEAEYFIDNPSAWSSFDQRASDAIAAVCKAFRAARAPADSVQEDAARYRWLAAHCRSTSEHWGGRWSIVVEGPAPKSHNSEDDFDAAVDAARKQGEKQ